MRVSPIMVSDDDRLTFDVSAAVLAALVREFWLSFDEEGATAVAAAWRLAIEEGRCPATNQTP